jgi:hypothetical protein
VPWRFVGSVSGSSFRNPPRYRDLPRLARWDRYVRGCCGSKFQQCEPRVARGVSRESCPRDERSIFGWFAAGSGRAEDPEQALWPRYRSQVRARLVAAAVGQASPRSRREVCGGRFGMSRAYAHR